jgi:predicted ester cyclase
MSTEVNKALIRRYREAHTIKNLTLLDEIVAPDIKSHSGIPGLPTGLQGGKMAHQTFLAAFPDGHVTTQDLIAEGDEVVERFSFRDTNTGSFMGAPATDKKVTFSGMSVFRIANGKIVEHWGANDALGTMQKNGAKEELDEEGTASTRYPTSPHFRSAPQSTWVHYLLSKYSTYSHTYYRHPSPKSPINFCRSEGTCV